MMNQTARRNGQTSTARSVGTSPYTQSKPLALSIYLMVINIMLHILSYASTESRSSTSMEALFERISSFTCPDQLILSLAIIYSVNVIFDVIMLNGGVIT